MKNLSSQTSASAKFWRRWMVIPVALGALGLLAAILVAIAMVRPSETVQATSSDQAHVGSHGPGGAGTSGVGQVAPPDDCDNVPCTHSAPLDPFRINQPPDFMMHSHARTDVVMQRLVFPGEQGGGEGIGGWHTHPGPSFVFVEAGEIRLDRFTKKDGCTETEVFGPGQAYPEIGNEVHRAVVVSEEDAVLHVTRFIPEGAAITTFVDDPDC